MMTRVIANEHPFGSRVLGLLAYVVGKSLRGRADGVVIETIRAYPHDPSHPRRSKAQFGEESIDQLLWRFAHQALDLALRRCVILAIQPGLNIFLCLWIHLNALL